MASAQSPNSQPKWVINLHGVREALTTTSNARARVIDAIQSGEMLILRSVSDELKATYPKLWPDFDAIKPRKYLTPSIRTIALASQLQETHGTSLLGGIPDFAHFEAVAAARLAKCKLVTAGKALAECKEIATSCGIPESEVVTISDV